MGMNEKSMEDKELELMKDFAVMEVKMDIMKIMFEQPTADAKVTAIINYILGDKDGN